MKITSATFIKSITGPDRTLADGVPQVAFIGRSNVGKSSTINALAKQKGLARASSSPGRTKEINLFLINKSFYLVDLPGYGFARGVRETVDQFQDLTYWYLFDSPYVQKKVVLIIDANIGPTGDDLEMLYGLERQKKNSIIVANKVDKLKKSQYVQQFRKITEKIRGHALIPFSAEKGLGVSELAKAITE